MERNIHDASRVRRTINPSSRVTINRRGKIVSYLREKRAIVSFKNDYTPDKYFLNGISIRFQSSNFQLFSFPWNSFVTPRLSAPRNILEGHSLPRYVLLRFSRNAELWLPSLFFRSPSSRLSSATKFTRVKWVGVRKTINGLPFSFAVRNWAAMQLLANGFKGLIRTAVYRQR